MLVNFMAWSTPSFMNCYTLGYRSRKGPKSRWELGHQQHHHAAAVTTAAACADPESFSRGGGGGGNSDNVFFDRRRIWIQIALKTGNHEIYPACKVLSKNKIRNVIF